MVEIWARVGFVVGFSFAGVALTACGASNHDGQTSAEDARAAAADAGPMTEGDFADGCLPAATYTESFTVAVDASADCPALASTTMSLPLGADASALCVTTTASSTEGAGSCLLQYACSAPHDGNATTTYTLSGSTISGTLTSTTSLADGGWLTCTYDVTVSR